MAEKNFTIKEKTAAGYDTLYPKTVAGQVYMEGGGTIAAAIAELSKKGGAGQTAVIYEQLKTMKNAGTLSPGAQYLLTDYATKYRMPYVNVIKETPLAVGKYERLVLTATSANTLSPVAASLDFPQDVVWYDFDDNLCEDGTTARKGFIQRRLDTKYTVDAPQDWRTMVWARMKATAQTWTSGAVKRQSAYQSGTNIYMAVKDGTPSSATDNNFFVLLCTTNDYFWTGARTLTGLTLNTADYAERYTFDSANSWTVKTPSQSATVFPEKIVIESSGNKSDSALKGLHNNVFLAGTSESNKLHSCWFSAGCYNNSFYLNCCNTTFGSNCHDNTFGSTCHSNSFGSNCYNNIFCADVNSVTLGSFCHDNTLGQRSWGNSFGSYCYNNILGGNVSSGSTYNTFGSNCYNNTLAYTGCGSNTFGSDCAENVLGLSGVYNTFDSGCQYNTLGNNCQYNSFGSYCCGVKTANNFRRNFLEPYIEDADMSAVTELHGKSYNHRIFQNSAYAYYAVHYVGTTPTYTVI